MNLSTRHLQLIVLLCEGYTLSAAAREMKTSQGHVSNMLAGLERAMGRELCKRNGKLPVRPTEALMAMEKPARKALALIREIRS